MDASIRPSVVAGSFYPGARGELERRLDDLVAEDRAAHDLLACVSPHAGYVYSGGVAGALFGHLRLPRRIIVLGPNHTGVGADVAVAPHASWSTPLGPQRIDVELARAFLDAVPQAQADDRAHGREHSIEVQLPFLMHRSKELMVLPVCLRHLRLGECLDLGGRIAALIEGIDEPVGIVASSDMTHYQPAEVARSQDRLAIDAVIARDPTELFQVVHGNAITMCGVIPATVAVAAANRLGATAAHLVAYATSGDVTGDNSAVVGYAGMCIHR
jgi:AmmeMemoRadiSam system protein B